MTYPTSFDPADLVATLPDGPALPYVARWEVDRRWLEEQARKKLLDPKWVERLYKETDE